MKRKYPAVKTITDHERIGMVKEIFSTITDKYDFLNHFLSMRRDIAWRRFAIKKMSFPDGGSFLDVACGTGDLSIGAALKYPQIKVTGIDFIPEMIIVGKEKVKKRGLSDRINL
ncbi:MAG TPA: class I SAM-dependent methyltransferase, partial [Syntrophorhabdaceae bacterium]|nr:class I SAM-dependent methyltransferase [Syntrophorhabdaceae bacterium]